MYDSMRNAVARVERSIEDVELLLQRRCPETWEVEWHAAVQELLGHDAGWG